MAREIEIIGGGLAGLSLGLGLRRADVPVRIYEAGDYPRHRVCGEFITGLDDTTIATLGLNRILADALRHREVAWFFGDRPATVHTLPRPALGISRYALDARLAEAFVAAGGELHPRTRVSDLAPRAGRVFATGRRRGRSGWLGLKVHVRGLPLERDLELHLGTDAYVGLSRVEDGWINVCGLFRQRAVGAPASRRPSTDRARDTRTSDTHSDAVTMDRPLAGARSHRVFLDYLRVAGIDRLAERIADAEYDPASVCSVAALEFDARISRSDRIQLGDACAMIPPFTGNGMAMAFQSAAVALEPLRRYAAGEASWLDTCRVTNAALRRRFRIRLTSAHCLHPFLLRRTRQHGLAVLSGAGVLPFRPLYALLH